MADPFAGNGDSLRTGPRPFASYEQKWQAHWEEQGTYKAIEGAGDKFYGLVEFPYPSGDGLHVGHPRSYTAIDVIVRKRRMEGKNVLYPMGWDAFGLPTENYAIKHKVKPQVATAKNEANFRRQLKSIGFGFDWSREIDTTDPKYYKWTQWMFLKFFSSMFDETTGKAKSVINPISAVPFDGGDEPRMAYKARTTINWCPNCKIGLANEEAVGGVCERCGNPVEKREKAQWMIRITKYAERLLKDLDTVDYLDKIKAQQTNWIGRSEGAYVDFKLSTGDVVRVFTTRPDTLFGATYLVLAPEHELVAGWIHAGTIINDREVNTYREAAAKKSDLERGAEGKEKTGVRLDGVIATNPANGEQIPVWIADYVLAGYGTGAIMAVPAHDERDFAFAKTFELPIKTVVEPITGTPRPDAEKRDSIIAIVCNPKDGSLLTLNWGDKGGRLFIGGGLEHGEDVVQAAIREIKEETGYQNVRLVDQSEIVHHHYFSFAKNKARTIDVTGLFFELVDEAQVETKREEHETFAVEWVKVGQAEKDIKDPAHAYLFRKFIKGECYGDDGIATGSDFLNGLTTADAKVKMIAWLEEQKIGQKAINYKLRDWVFSRQRYWGEPIPVIICEMCGYVPVPEDQLPVLLPDVDSYEPTDTGESPLSKIREWVEVKCPSCGADAERETDTMPNWAGSSWYFMRYCDPHNDQAFASPEALTFWMPVDLYNGGMEHTTLHLLYSRFWHKLLWDVGVMPQEIGPEPYKARRSHGLILAEGGEKMSKSKGNVINPDEIVEQYGADVLRGYELFMGPFDQPVPWDVNGIEGVKRFLDKVWRLFKSDAAPDAAPLETIYNQTLKKIADDIESLSFNTAISQLMILTNAYTEAGGVPTSQREGYLKILAPFVPHVTEELWSQMGKTDSIHQSTWPSFDPSKVTAATFELVIQVNGKVRDKLSVPTDISEDEAKAKALASEKVKAHLGDKQPSKIIYVKGRLVTIVV
jgi:leucyl-tRNA synthetase